MSFSIIRKIRWCLVGLMVMTTALSHASEDTPAGKLDAKHLSNLKWRHIGPSICSGRIVDFAVVESNPKIIYAASASGGVWKTSNNGTTWKPVFEREATISVGAVAVSRANPNIVWVGTGESNNQRSSSWGDGLYKSEDGGSSWKRRGLEKSQHIGRVLIHPEDPNVVYVAAAGALWGPSQERGVYKTNDGGKTWEKKLWISQHTGVVDIAMDPRDPEVIYAGAYQRERRNWSFLGGGPEGGIHKTTDGGESWEPLTHGTPKSDIGRIGLSVCRSHPDTIYATIEAKQGGVFRSDDRGASWRKVNSLNPTPWYYSQIRCDPTNPEKVWVLGTRLSVSENGGKDFRNDGAPQIHVDHHSMWINPTDSNHVVLGNDGGVSITYDGGRNWDYMSHIPVVQFYTVAVDMREPFYYVYGGTQDNNTWGGPSGTRNSDGITNEDWYVTVGGDGFYAQIDPKDPTIVYSESQYGNIVRFNTVTGERRRIQPQPPTEDETYRWNWSSPILISPHDHTIIYFAANKLFKSPNQGDTWEVISLDLTRQLDRDEMPMMGKNWPKDAVAKHQGVSKYGNVTTADESKLRQGLLAVGTDDGLIQVSRDGGETWTKIDELPGVPELTRVSRVIFSQFDEATLYATFDGHKDNNFLPYVYKSPDYGTTWTSITGDLPEFGSTRVIREHPRNNNLLFVGTEFGVFVSITGGNHWVQIKNNLPTIAVHDIVVHPRENDLVIATHGRGFWVLDDIGALEELSAEALQQTSKLFPVRSALQFHDYNRGRGFMGARYFRADNPPRGAIITYYVNPELVKTPQKGDTEVTDDSNGKVATQQSPGGQPSQGGEKKDENRAPQIGLEILDGDGNLVRRLDVPQGTKGAGIQRVVWDMRHTPPYTPSDRRQQGFFRSGPTAPWVLPGDYHVKLDVGNDEHIEKVTIKGDPLTQMRSADRKVWHDTLLALSQLTGAVNGAVTTAEQLEASMEAVQTTLKSYPTALEEIAEEAKRIAKETKAILKEVRGETGSFFRGDDDGPPPILRVVRTTYFAVEASTALPTDDQRRLTRRSHERLSEQVEKLNKLLGEDVPVLNDKLDTAGVPWTPGRTIVLPPESLLPPK